MVDMFIMINVCVCICVCACVNACMHMHTCMGIPTHQQPHPPQRGPEISKQLILNELRYSLGMVNSKFHLIRSFFEIFARFLSYLV